MNYNPLITSIRIVPSTTPDASPEMLEQYGVPGGLDACLLQLDAYDAQSGEAAPVFVFQVGVRDARAQTDAEKYIGFFSNCCSPADWQALPIGPPGVATTDTMFRESTVRFVCENPRQAAQILDSIAEQLSLLTASHKMMSTPPGSTYRTPITV